MSIIIGADIVPTKSNYRLFETAQADELVGRDLLSILKSADYRIFNLETPLTNKRVPIKKYGPTFAVSTQVVAGFKALQIDLFTLSNNHIMDQGVSGLKETCDTLEENGIQYIGVGENSALASRHYVIPLAEKNIGIYVCSEHEYAAADESNPGAYSFDPLETPDEIYEFKKKCDFLIVLYHGGIEYYRYPSVNLQKTCRKLVQKGADLVICQHSHCIGCEEKYLNGTIIYGQGNFLFDNCDNEFWKTGLLVEIHDDFEIEYIPITKHLNTVRLATKEQSAKILEEFNNRSNDIKTAGFVEKKYDEFCRKICGWYYLELSDCQVIIFILRILAKILGMDAKYIIGLPKNKRRHFLATRNYIECEAHREAILRGMKQ